MKKILLFILILFIPFYINAEELNLEWKQIFGGSKIDVFNNFVVTETEEIIAFGYAESTDIEGLTVNGIKDAIIIKYDKDGNLLWQKNWGGNLHSAFNDLIVTETKEIIAIGYTESTDIEELANNGGQDAIIVKYDKDGNLLWHKNYGGSATDSFSKHIVTETGEIIVTGYTNSTDIEGLANNGGQDVIIVKYDQDGNMLWQKNFGGNGNEDFSDIYLSDNGDIIVYGYTFSTDIEGMETKGGQDAIIVKYDKDGNLLWQRSFGGSSNDNFLDLKITDSKEIIASGYTTSTDIEGLETKGGQDAIIVKYDKDGNLLWQNNFGGSSYDAFATVVTTELGDIIAYGTTKSTDIEGLTINEVGAAIIVKYDINGNLLWQNNFAVNTSSIYSDFMMNEMGDIIAIGYKELSDSEELENYDLCDSFIVKYDKTGKLIWQQSFDDETWDIFINMMITKSGNIIIGGKTTNAQKAANDGDSDALILKYSIEYNIENLSTENGTSVIEQQGSNAIITSTPNEGYEVDEIIVRDKEGKVLNVAVTKLSDRTYLVPLYTDVSIEVLYKKSIVNPKTGVSSMLGVIFTMMIIAISAFFVIKKCNESYEL